jgi:hypothetical protein
MQLHVIDSSYLHTIHGLSFSEAWWDVLRLKYIIDLLLREKKPIVHCDIDIILEKNIEELVNLPYSTIISKEHFGNQAYPKECSQLLGFGVCTGFYIVKYESVPFLLQLYKSMFKKEFGVYSDQVTMMHLFTKPEISKVEKIYDHSNSFEHILIHYHIQSEEKQRILVLDMDALTRDPLSISKQYGNHINIDSVGGNREFIRYFYEPLLPRK